MKAKLFESYGEGICYNEETFFHSFTDWEEISEEDLKYIIKWVEHQNYKQPSSKRYNLITESDITLKETISQIIEIEKRKEKQKELINKKAEAKKEKLEENRKKKKEEKERKKFEELKKKFG